MTLARQEALAARHGRVRSTFGAAGIDALLVTHVPNLFYLTNFTGTTAAAILTPGAVHFITDFRYVSTVESVQSGQSACPGLVLHRVEQSYEETMAGLAHALDLSRLGVEASHLSLSRYNWLTSTLGTRGVGLLPTEGLVEAARVVKDAAETATLREAARRLSAVAEGVLADIREGLRETDVALEIEIGMRRMGFTRPAFDTIVAAGARSALPHARAGDAVFARSDLVVLDFGGVYNGYCVDLTRTVSIGPPSAAARRLYDAVHRAQRAALDAVQPGAATSAIDRAARQVLEDAGYGAAFGHGTGHGLGIEVHEAPRVAQPRRGLDDREYPPGHLREPTVVVPGMVFTVEPGAYLTGFGGVRIEDDVLVTDVGCEILTTVDRDLRVC